MELKILNGLFPYKCMCLHVRDLKYMPIGRLLCCLHWRHFIQSPICVNHSKLACIDLCPCALRLREWEQQLDECSLVCVQNAHITKALSFALNLSLSRQILSFQSTAGLSKLSDCLKEFKKPYSRNQQKKRQEKTCSGCD